MEASRVSLTLPTCMHALLFDPEDGGRYVPLNRRHCLVGTQYSLPSLKDNILLK
jgi:hypothetical protein